MDATTHVDPFPALKYTRNEITAAWLEIHSTIPQADEAANEILTAYDARLLQALKFASDQMAEHAAKIKARANQIEILTSNLSRRIRALQEGKQ